MARLHDFPKLKKHVSPGNAGGCYTPDRPLAMGFSIPLTLRFADGDIQDHKN
jgi:hypothetical protein